MPSNPRPAGHKLSIPLFNFPLELRPSESPYAQDTCYLKIFLIFALRLSRT
jgi:hypothetical protein